LKESSESANYRPRRFFSLQEANGALTLVRRITGDIVEHHRKISELYCRARELSDEGRQEEAEAFGSEIRERFVEIDACVKELDGIGCIYRDRVKGLVDFPSRMGDRIVFLCWRLGEPEILYWHGLHAGFNGRQPIATFISGADPVRPGPQPNRRTSSTTETQRAQRREEA
jgi:hypothetical protein